MRESRRSGTRLLAVSAAAAIVVVGVAAVALAAGGATSSATKVKVKCPKRVLSGGKKVTCKLTGKLPRGAQGPQGPRGQKGQRGERGPTGARGATGAAGVSGYEVVAQTFEDVFVINSGGQRGLSEVKTVACPAGKRAIGGGTDLGTDEAQNGPQRQVTVSLNGPNGTGTGWSAQLFNNSVSVDVSIDLRIYAICASAN